MLIFKLHLEDGLGNHADLVIRAITKEVAERKALDFVEEQDLFNQADSEMIEFETQEILLTLDEPQVLTYDYFDHEYERM